jgi:hypothetical protein
MSEDNIKDNKEYRVYIVNSKNSERYYISYSRHKGYISMVLHNMISRYKKIGNKPEKYREFFYIIALNDLSIKELGGFDKYEDAIEYIDKYKKENDGFVKLEDVRQYTFNGDEIKTGRVKVDKKEYLKEYYKNNKDKYLERYRNNKEEILTKMKSEYKKKKKNID